MIGTKFRVLAGSGLLASIQPSPYIPGAFTLSIDDTPQSDVNLQDPGRLFLEYVQRMGHAIDLVGAPGQPVTAVHLGAGGLTLPRYIAHTRPGSDQTVIEVERDLVPFVRKHLPLPPEARIQMRYKDARVGLSTLPPRLRGMVDVLIVDVFSGSHTPVHVTTLEFYSEAAALLSADGIMLVNVMDAPGLEFARAQAATLAAAVPWVAAMTHAQALAGKDSGNVVLVGSRLALPDDWVPRMLAAGPHPSATVAGDDLRTFCTDAPIVTDAASGHGSDARYQPL